MNVRDESSQFRLLVVDDCDFWREWIAGLFRDDFTIATAPNGAIAWELLRSENCENTVLVTDNDMPCMTGVTLLETIAAGPSRIRGAVLLSGDPEIIAVQGPRLKTLLAAVQTPLYAFCKPFDLPQLRKCLTEIANGAG